MLDLVIRGGRVVDGSGSPWFTADVGVQGTRIVAVGDHSTVEARQVIDAARRMVSPGFIDSHSHSDWSIMANRRAESSVRMGVTTEVIGNCGMSYAPLTERNRAQVAKRLAETSPGSEVTWTTFAEYLEALADGGISENVVPLVGHGCIRTAAMGPDLRPATPEEVQRMEALVAEAMEAGAVGLSTGLEYMPGRVATEEELITLNRVVSRYGGLHASHQRNRDVKFEESAAEILRVCEVPGTRFQMSHVNARPGAAPGAWERVMDQIDAARRRGLDVAADATTYERGIGVMSAVLPPWLFDGGPATAAERLGDPVIRERVRNDCRRYWLLIADGEWHRVWLGPTKHSREYFGKSFVEIGERRGQDPFDSYCDILQAEGADLTEAVIFGEVKTPEHLRQMITHPLFTLEADAWTATVDGPLAPLVNHPSTFGWTARVIGEYARDQHWLPVEEMIRKMTSFPATRFGLADRGLVRPGLAADLVVFDLPKLRATSTYENPRQYPEGIETVIVNGQVTVAKGEHTGAMGGQVLRRQ